ncbi:hypothetical protein H9657_04170 [Cellulomonas sp. Sa3CUA2]|uniref:Uncharacterized protein n=1 Tax=Cellulomonas avistercoris TaxID=2762242 RepID=A0ABR8QAN6_9CELL|nr:hypothetical protein [Cellulomonas avistercoris]MBD7917475.1 hypothetical protein [Cellulomonas avistercoris]
MYWLGPAVDGGLGPGVDYDVTRDPHLVGELTYEFDDWTGDDITETAGYWLVSDRLAQALSASPLTGWELAPVRVTTSDVFDQLHPDGLGMPTWHRLVPTGTPGDDITLVGRVYLCVSDRALQLLRHFTIEHAAVRPVSEIPTR